MFNFWRPRARNPQRCVLLGSDTSGKTTLLYMWHTGSVVRPTPTIGFNLETVTKDGKTMEVLDFGGCDKLAPMARHYLDSTTGVLFLHALHDATDRVEQSIELLHMHVGQLVEAGGKHIWVMVTKQDLVPVEELATRRTELYELLHRTLRRCEPDVEWKIFDQPGLSALDEAQVRPIFHEIVTALDRQDEKTKYEPVSRKYSEIELRNRIEQEGQGEQPPEQFWHEFITAELSAWNHRNHLRAGYLVLLKSADMLEDFWAAVDTFLAHIERLRTTRPDRFRNTTHRTMTTFWLYTLQLAIIEFRNTNSTRLPTETVFQDILLQKPRLMDTSYWEDYYSRVTMFSPEAKQNWCLPDKKPLPINFSRHTSDSIAGSAGSKRVKSSLKTIERQDGGEHEQDQLISFALSVVQEYLETGKRRGEVIAPALSLLQKSTLQSRASNPPIPVAIYSETQAYFWIQIVHATLLPFHTTPDQNALNQSVDDDLAVEASKRTMTLTYPEFSHIFGTKPDLWKKYYSKNLWNSIGARMSFAAPDLCPLPNVFPRPPSGVAARNLLETKAELLAGEQTLLRDEEFDAKEVLTSNRTAAEIAMRVNMIASEVAEAAHKQKVVEAATMLAKPEPLTSHAHLLHILYVSMIRSMTQANSEIDISKFIATVISLGSIQDRDSYFKKLDVTNSNGDTSLVPPVGEVELPSRKGTNSMQIGMTKLVFYARMALALKTFGALETRQFYADKNIPAMTFRDFLISQTALLWDDLQYRYYTHGAWNSLNAKIMVIQPDLRALPSY